MIEFAARGFTGARTARIAEYAQVNKQLLYYYFRSKRGLYRAVIEDTVQLFRTGTSVRLGTDSPVDRLRRRLQDAVQFLLSHPDRTHLLTVAVTASDEEGEMVRGALREFARQLEGEVSSAQGMGFFRDDVDPQLAAVQAVTLIFGYFSITPALLRQTSDCAPESWAQGAGDLLSRAMSW